MRRQSTDTNKDALKPVTVAELLSGFEGALVPQR